MLGRTFEAEVRGGKRGAEQRGDDAGEIKGAGEMADLGGAVGEGVVALGCQYWEWGMQVTLHKIGSKVG